jgi:protein-arginine kinase activator protein McsA
MKPFDSKKKGPTKVESLKKELDRAVENEDFLLAIKIRDMIKDFENNKELITELEVKLKDCIEKQDFEQAIEIREQLKKYQS